MWRKEKRKIYLRKIKNFWLDFSHNKVGFAGLAILIFFTVTAVFSSVFAPQDPIYQDKVAARYAGPGWLKIFPQYARTPITHDISFNVTEAQPYNAITTEYPEGSSFVINYLNDGNLSEQIYIFQREFDYQYEKPRDWSLKTSWSADFSDLDYRLEFHFRLANGSEYIIYGVDYDVWTKRVHVLPKMWNVRADNDITTSGSTYLNQRIYYEKFYQERYDYHIAKYSAGNFTITPEFLAFTSEGFQNKSKIEVVDNPIYSQYLDAVSEGQTNATWIEYWQAWNSSDGAALWLVTYEYMKTSWVEFVKTRNITSYASAAYLAWDLGKPEGADYNYKDSISWSEFMNVWNLTFTSIKDDWNDYVNTMNRTDPTSPAYVRWLNLNATGQTDAPWTKYLEMWIDIQSRASSSFLSKYVAPLEAAHALADRLAKEEAFTLAAVAPVPTYFLQYNGTQALLLKLHILPKSENATLSLTFGETSKFTVWGSVWGLLGTTSFGYDVWTQLIHGARVSLIVGSLAAVLATSLGIFFGVTAGYVSGIVDEAIMRIVDVLLCLPVLPLLLTLAAYWSPNVYYLVIIIAIFGWQGLSRIIRSRVLSLREMPFIESAKASGASSSYLIFRHLIPNVFPLAMASLVLAVPGAILTEAALSFLGFGDPLAPTWGKMLHEAQAEGAFAELAWWYVIPPGIAITFLCLAFVFIGHALDEIVNPRLRRRR
ncbi:MAG: ABC transporter permease [Candidatus Bathyarchaeota archaeon]|nr:MAG: ABC transporter permease [Candidatus Bathyarchaeota archaeon]